MAPTALITTMADSEKTSSIPLSNGVKKGSTSLQTLSKFQDSMKTAPPPTARTYAPRTDFSFDSIDDALEAFKNGEFLVVMDDENRENEGDLIIAGAHCTTEKMAWMIRHTSGFICISLPGDRLKELELPLMIGEENQDPQRTAYTISTDYKHGTTTGISAHDRALTALALSYPGSSPSDFTRPGHLMPLLARSGGVLTRRGHTEAGVDLCKLTGLPPAGVLCELVNDLDDDSLGGMMRRDECRRFADKWGLKMISIEMLVELKRRSQ
ncbi:3,4-dihydroxy 2-butanone 4-phosphate synthase [Marasmius crinis-equi]|uniref:3,4-dihydroxy-2-butanone 4-phosphate synthase n=1 Tax=Marasmius crinis-equi TaxID=585013 RepID=A0ABR3F625_9AGAR